MPQTLSAITSQFFINLINRLGVRPPPPDAFFLSNVVTPVSIVDSDISIPSIVTSTLLDLSATQGELLAPAANTLLADTGALPAGNYNIVVILGIDGIVAGVAPLRVQRRDAANAANVWSQLLSLNNAGLGVYVFSAQVRILLNERIRVVVSAAGVTAGLSVQASIWAVLVQ